MPTKPKQIRQSISLPPEVAKKVQSLAKSCRQSMTRVVVDLVRAGLDAKSAEKQHFLELADRLARTSDAAEQLRIKGELARLTFGD